MPFHWPVFHSYVGISIGPDLNVLQVWISVLRVVSENQQLTIKAPSIFQYNKNPYCYFRSTIAHSETTMLNSFLDAWPVPTICLHIDHPILHGCCVIARAGSPNDECFISTFISCFRLQGGFGLRRLIFPRKFWWEWQPLFGLYAILLFRVLRFFMQGNQSNSYSRVKCFSFIFYVDAEVL